MIIRTADGKDVIAAIARDAAQIRPEWFGLAD